MTLSATIKTGATTVAATAGDDQLLVPLGINNNTNVVFYDDDGAYSSRRTATFSVKEPKINASSPGGYTQERRTVVFRRPITLANGETTVETLRVEHSTATETLESDKLEMREQVAQLMVNTDFANFWHEGVLS
jgi:hypothetical protein